METYTRILVHFSGFQRFMPSEPDDIRVWDGNEDIVYEGATWEGIRTGDAAVLDVTSLHSQQGLPDRRVTLSMSVTPDALATFWANDYTGLDVDIGFIVSSDAMRTWARRPQRFRGRISETEIDGGVASAQIETYLGDVDRGIVRYWDDASHQARFPGDTGFRRKAALADEIELEGWPT